MIDTSNQRAPARALSAFGQREDGSLTIFGLLIFMLMMTAGGIALDIMRSEVNRTELQYATDRASLAAAGLNQTRSAEEIVKDYIRAAGLDEDSIQVTSVQNGSDRRVTVSADSVTNSLFLDLLGVETLIQPISSEAREVQTELELSLVVDISGSMGGAKIETLRTAASDFVAELLRGREDLTSISLVPYNDRVNAGPLMASVFDTSDEHPFSNCFVFPDSDFSRMNMGAGDELQRMGHFDFRTSYRQGNNPGLVDEPNCQTDSYGAILPWSNNVTELQTRIAALNASHWTAMDLGVKWGTLLLDPSSRDELTELVTMAGLSAEERVDAEFIGRPSAYNTDGTHKVLVVMTDGVNTQQWDLKDNMKEGPSGVYVYREALTYTCRDYQRDTFYSDGSRVDRLGRRDAARCDDWDDAGRPEPYADATDAPLVEVDFGAIVGGVENACTLGTVALDNEFCGTLSGTILDIDGTTVNINLFGSDGSACLYGTEMQRALCRTRFDDDEGNRYVPRYSVWSPQVGAYWVDHRNQYWNSPYGGSNAVQLDWSEVFAALSMSFIANDILMGANWNTRVDYFYSWETTHRQSRADNNLSAICQQARQNSVVIYTIAFQAPDDGEAAMLDCAGVGNEARYFNVEDLDIAAAFDDVLASVSRLRLTQ